jgi:hypothetical protein
MIFAMFVLNAFGLLFEIIFSDWDNIFWCYSRFLNKILNYWEDLKSKVINLAFLY